MTRASLITAGFLFFVTVPSLSLSAQEEWNPGAAGGAGNQEGDMHACPAGTAIAAVRSIGSPTNFNDFLCRKVTNQPSLVETQTSNGQRQVAQSHTCPKGFYLRGMRIDQNRFLCSRHRGGNLNAEIQVVNDGMHCGIGQVMVGYNDQKRRVLCSSIDGI